MLTIEQFKKSLGTGFRRNLFSTEIEFIDVPKPADLIGGINLANPLSSIRKVVKNVSSNVSDSAHKQMFFKTIQAELAKAYVGHGIVKNIKTTNGNETTNVTNNTIFDFLSLDIYSGNALKALTGFWTGNCIGANLASLETEISDEYDFLQRNVVGRKVNDISLTFINDQFNINRMFWYVYISKISNGRITRFARDYKFTLYVYISGPSNDGFGSGGNGPIPSQVFTFYNCFPTAAPNIDLKSDSMDIDSFDVTITFSDFTISYLTAGAVPI